tara:strand:+ start:4265 stop:4690 length:426 start_codon:yes stop_codon:yes gene_type:complete
MQIVRFAFAIVAICLGSAVSAEVYQWTDSNGRVQYSDVKPSDGTPYKSRHEFDLPYLHRADPVKSQRYSPPTKPKTSRPQATMIERQRIGRSRDDSYPCKGYLEALEQIQDRMRRGYNVRQSNYYREKKRDISDRYYKECR